MRKIELRKFNFFDCFRVVLIMTDKQHSKEMHSTSFQYFIKFIKSIFRKNELYKFSIIVNKKYVGYIGLSNTKENCYEVGYFILRQFRTKNIATRALQQLMKIIKTSSKISK